MAKVNMQSKVNVGADMLWNTIGGFNALPAWHPAFKSSQATGEKGGFDANARPCRRRYRSSRGSRT